MICIYEDYLVPQVYKWGVLLSGISIVLPLHVECIAAVFTRSFGLCYTMKRRFPVHSCSSMGAEISVVEGHIFSCINLDLWLFEFRLRL